MANKSAEKENNFAKKGYISDSIGRLIGRGVRGFIGAIEGVIIALPAYLYYAYGMSKSLSNPNLSIDSKLSIIEDIALGAVSFLAGGLGFVIGAAIGGLLGAASKDFTSLFTGVGSLLDGFIKAHVDAYIKLQHQVNEEKAQVKQPQPVLIESQLMTTAKINAETALVSTPTQASNLSQTAPTAAVVSNPATSSVSSSLAGFLSSVAQSKSTSKASTVVVAAAPTPM